MGWLSKNIRARIWRTNNDFLVLLCGTRGTGKSLSAISLALSVDPTFKKERILFSIEDFMGLLNAGKLRRGQAVVFDEIGVAANVKEHQSQANKAASFIMQIVRPYNLCVIFTVPSLDFIDKQVRKLFNAYLETWPGNFTRDDYARAKIRWLQYNPRIDKLYFHTPTTKINGHKVEVTELHIKKPPEKWAKMYARRRKEYVLSLSGEQTDIIAYKKAYLRRKSAAMVAQEVLNNPKALKRYKVPWPSGPEGQKVRFDQSLIASGEKCGLKTAYGVKRILESRLLRIR